MKKTHLYILFIVLSFVLNSCTSNQEKIIGTWKFSSIHPELRGEAKSKEFKVRQMRKEFKGELYTFKENGHGIHLKNGITEEFTYKLNSFNELCLNDSEDVFKVSTLIDRKMSWFF